MPSRYNLPHIDIARFASEYDYSGDGGFGDPAARDRAEHGRRLQGELDAALAMADHTRPTDDRLPPATGTRIEVELRRGTDPEVLNLKTQGIRAGASKFTANNDRTIALYVPDQARPALAANPQRLPNRPGLRQDGQSPAKRESRGN